MEGHSVSTLRGGGEGGKAGQPANLPGTTRTNREMLNAMASFSFLSRGASEKLCWYAVDVLQGEGSMCPGSSGQQLGAATV